MRSAINELYKIVLQQYNRHKSFEAFTIAISGIDASGKGYIASRLKFLLEQEGLRVALLAMDDWQMPKTVAIHDVRPAENFYYNVYRWASFFDSLFFPLKKQRGIDLSVKQFSNPYDEIITREYQYHNTDIIITEGIFLLKRDLHMLFDYKIWVECPFEKSMSRALLRNQEGLSNIQMVDNYRTVYHPAQRFHFEKDHPQANAHYIFNNSEDN